MAKTMKIFYDNNALPYKDSARQVHYPIIGNSFVGSSLVDTFRFYVGEIGGIVTTTWVASIKLPNGNLVYKLLTGNYETIDSVSEPYVDLPVSSDLTQIKGDLYIALNGYQGGADVDYDDETGLWTISGNPVIQATGGIKYTIAYAPLMPQGYNSVSTISVQEALALVSGKLAIENGIAVVDNVSNTNLNDFEEGQIVFAKTKRLFYIRGTSAWSVLEYPRINFTTSGTILTVQLLQGAQGTSPTVISSANIDLANQLVSLNTDQELYGSKTFIYTQYFGSSSEEQYGKIGLWNKATNGYDYLYGGIDSDTFEFPFFDCDLGVSGNLYLPNSFCMEEDVWLSSPQQSGTIATQEYVDSGLLLKADKSNTYTKAQVDSIVSTLNANSFINVDTTEYPTLADFLASTGEEGHVYLYPIDLTDLSKGYDQYIWESGDWLHIGTTEIDLSNYVNLSSNQTINGTKTFISPLHIGNTNNVGKIYLYNTDSGDLDDFISGGDIDHELGWTCPYINASFGIMGELYLHSDLCMENGKGIFIESEDNDKNLLLPNISTWSTDQTIATEEYVNAKTIAGISLTTNISAQDLTDALVFMNNTTDIDYVMED